ncbi:DUF4254 domain-containing protein [Nocardia nova]|uniref:DUF4254 domain-containing protein n=1 Tax=Nocardia nova TaxID=37330 RepID=UPI0034055D1F
MSAAPQPSGRAARTGPGGLRGPCAAEVGRGAVGTGAPDTAVHRGLPDEHEILAACCGHIGDHTDDHPVTRCARELAELHLLRRGTPMRAAEIDCRRREIVVAIDHWIGARTAAPARARSLGAAVDGLAAAQVRATVLLRAIGDTGDERVQVAWSMVGFMAEDWAGLVAQQSGDRRRAR